MDVVASLPNGCSCPGRMPENEALILLHKRPFSLQSVPQVSANVTLKQSCSMSVQKFSMKKFFGTERVYIACHNQWARKVTFLALCIFFKLLLIELQQIQPPNLKHFQSFHSLRFVVMRVVYRKQSFPTCPHPSLSHNNMLACSLHVLPRISRYPLVSPGKAQ